ncbi:MULTISPECIES: histidinol dehydrogenase [Bacillaceae]|uniref:histidinol dehydrogenase n=1 Tax=Bacillales TaxID=1385 RepID=UPI00188438AC|nr:MULTISPECIES: histidinol dehydrogenase [Bacillaceae]MBF0705676.1 histidinol dehydrogenase [Pseudalkalibacillus hwajinpoensis]MDO6657892.1 histidinol dehydrogenase [Anaerobacillus sp. 1_MG-2023]
MKIVNRSEGASIKRSIEQGTEEQRQAVLSILSQVKATGDEAVKENTKKFDGADLKELRVSNEEIERAYRDLSDELITTIRQAAGNIQSFHERQRRQSWFTTSEDGTMLGQKVTPLDSVGVYVPGGKAAYPSSVLMNVIPAVAAGVKRIAMVTPPDSDGNVPSGVLVAANEVGVSEIFKVGGAQAVGALAYGTESIAPVDKIVGPGNIFVALAKREVFGIVDIDMIAGPSEIVVLADEKANPAYVAADLLSQAEHDERASAVLVTTSETLAERVQEEVKQQLVELPRAEIASKSIDDYGMIYVVNHLAEAVDAVNELAPEHLEIMVEEPMTLLGKIRHAGAIFLGPYSSEPVGDYFAGPNHVLPTNGTARFSSPLSVDDFIKKSSVISYSKEAMRTNGSSIAALAKLEGLDAHARAVELRLEDL